MQKCYVICMLKHLKLLTLVHSINNQVFDFRVSLQTAYFQVCCIKNANPVLN